jgi:PEP-CTERM motif
MKRVGFVIAVFMTILLLPVGRANAVACGTWYPTPTGENIVVHFEELVGNTCSYELEYLEEMFPGDPVDLVFNAPAPGTYTFTTFPVDTIVNSTSFVWNDYHYELGTGFQATFVNFNSVVNNTAIGPQVNGFTPAFTAVAVSDVLTTVNVSPHSVAFTGGIVPNGPGNLVNFTVNVNVPEGFVGPFTLRQDFSVVPEPATLALLALGLAGIATSRRRKLN